MTLESFHDGRRLFCPLKLILLHGYSRPHTALLSHVFRGLESLWYPASEREIQMESDTSFRCYRYGGQVQLAGSADDTQQAIRTITLTPACPVCGQGYDFQYVLSAIFASSADGEAQALLHHYERCGRLYLPQEKEPHVCDGGRHAGGDVPGEGS